LTRSNAKSLITLLSIYSNSTREEQRLFIQELTNNFNIKNEDWDFIYQIENAIKCICLDIKNVQTSILE